jgi:hypothetical protein
MLYELSQGHQERTKTRNNSGRRKNSTRSGGQKQLQNESRDYAASDDVE